MKPRHIAMGCALVLAAGLVVFGDTTPDNTLSEPAERVAKTAATAPARSTAVPVSKPVADTAIVRLVPRDELIGAEGERFGDGEQALFARHDWTPPPPPPPPNVPPPPPPPPVAPPLPFKYIGKSLQDGVWEIYLARNDRTYLVRDGATIDGAYRVDAIRPPTLTLTYLPLDQVQQLNIGVFD
ncbi:hypothetical protein HD842_000386 [Massilia aurea]|uniref:Prolin-rich transmembrane protein n=1 Tax=Massilia aurea TaxID=373040 RepID=A0A7W9U616_9BURK|nr:hypothetical protein [Massilia aurea]MBB6132275.1 hypothetical protein [Massilia aurea]